MPSIALFHGIESATLSSWTAIIAHPARIARECRTCQVAAKVNKFLPMRATFESQACSSTQICEGHYCANESTPALVLRGAPQTAQNDGLECTLCDPLHRIECIKFRRVTVSGLSVHEEERCYEIPATIE